MSAAAVVAALFLLALAAGGALGFLSRRAAAADAAHSPLAAAIDSALPQLQCGECGYPGCRPYAEAVARNAAPINLCPPGGQETADRLARIVNADAPPMPSAPPRKIAVIRAEDCVGCALCLPACPTDAILGAPQKHHFVLAEHCVGCALCLPPCPADCIDMIEIPPPETAQQTAANS
ncbi:MAG: RnfABCDGE type electron transport complex subunit B [Gammaproteobacteria bacterium]